MPDTDTRYVFDSPAAAEADRLALGETLWDPGTFARLDALGLGAGWSCLDVGAGRGSVARWLVERVGSTGRVAATDLRVDRLEHLRRHRVDLTAHDIDADDLPTAAYDLVHARLVVAHLADRPAAVTRMRRALRPGGYLVLEDADGASLFRHPDREDFHGAVKRAAYAVMADAGHHPRCGLLNAQLAESAGLADVRVDGRSVLVRGGSAEARWYALWLAHLRDAMLAAGQVTGREIDQALTDLADPAQRWLSQVMVTVVGRQP